MQYSQLRAFHNVALHGGFSRAAEALNLTQPAISEQVRKLEQAHDTLLFSRERKRVSLTPAGEALFLLTRRLFEIESEIVELLAERRGAMDGTLRIMADSAHHLGTLLGRFRDRYPRVKLNLRTGNTAEVLNALRRYDAEIGVIGIRVPGREFVALDMGRSDIVAFSAKDFLPQPPDHLTLAELSKLPLILREEGSKTRQKLLDAAAADGITLTPSIEAEGRETVRELVAAGAGIGVVSRAEFGHDPRLQQIRLTGNGLEMAETLIHLSQRRDVRLIRAFMDMARDG